MKPFFKNQDFISLYGLVERKVAADIANRIFNEAMENWTVVYGQSNINSGGEFIWSKIKRPPSDTHKALLCFIEELPKESCKHEPENAVASAEWDPVRARYDIKETYAGWKCKHCGVKLVATWLEDGR